ACNNIYYKFSDIYFKKFRVINFVCYVQELGFKMIEDALITKMDNIMDRTNLRPLLALIAIMTYICYNSRHSPEKLTDLPRLFRRCPIMVDKAKRNAEINNVAMNTTNNSQTAEKVTIKANIPGKNYFFLTKKYLKNQKIYIFSFFVFVCFKGWMGEKSKMQIQMNRNYIYHIVSESFASSSM
ncbi:hypothetical protein RFI_35333, partial [Reticulomyxa filosa]